MALIEKLVGKVIKTGRLTLVGPDGRRQEFGPGGGKHLTVRVADRRTAFAIAQSPRIGLGEAYMDGRITIEDGDILDLMQLVTGANRWEDKGSGRAALNRGKRRWKALFRRNPLKRARRNVAHHYDIGNDFYRLFLDEDMQYSCAYFTDPSNSLDQAQSDKKAHIAAKLDLKPGQHVLDIGCGWGGTALVPESGRRRSGDRRDAVGRAAQDRAAASRGSWRRRPSAVRADRLPPGRRPVRPNRLDRHVRACRRRALRRVLPEVPPALETGRSDAAPHHRQVRESGRWRPTPSPTNTSSPAITCRP